MRKTLLLAGVATALFAMNANAIEYTPYISGKITRSEIKVDGSQTSAVNPAFNASADIEDKVWGFNAAVGASTKVPYGAIRAEFEFGYKDGMEDNYTDAAGKARGASAVMEADIATYMFNAYYDIDTGTKLTPYVGAGIGYAYIDAKSNYKDGAHFTNVDESEGNFAWQLSAGASYALTDKVSLDLGYRYMDMGSVSSTTHFDNDKSLPINMDTDFESHELMLGARYTF